MFNCLDYNFEASRILEISWKGVFPQIFLGKVSWSPTLDALLVLSCESFAFTNVPHFNPKPGFAHDSFLTSLRNIFSSSWECRWPNHIDMLYYPYLCIMFTGIIPLIRTLDQVSSPLLHGPWRSSRPKHANFIVLYFLSHAVYFQRYFPCYNNTS